MKKSMFNDRLEFRLFKSEKSKIRSDAKLCRMSVGSYLRALADRLRPIPYFTDEDRARIAKLIGLRSAIKNLHNLFGKKITPELETQLSDTLDEINRYLKSLGK